MTLPLAEDGRGGVGDSRHPTVFFFTSPSCPHCRAIGPMVRNAAEEYDGEVRLVEVDVSADIELARRLGVHATPTLVAVNGDAEIARHVGGGSSGDVSGLFASALAGAAAKRGRIGSFERVTRLGAAVLVTVVAVVGGAWWLLLAAGLFLFAALHDLLPRIRNLPVDTHSGNLQRVGRSNVAAPSRGRTEDRR